MSVGIHRVGVVGAGTMGNGIAQVFAAAGYPVTMRDLGAEFLNRGYGNDFQKSEPTDFTRKVDRQGPRRGTGAYSANDRA